jgi:prophage maintenance system killer protein
MSEVIDTMRNEIIMFEEENIKLEVNIKDNTVWLNRHQMAELFNRNVKTIGKHINNALSEELKGESTVAKFATVQKEATRDVDRIIEHYNLDVVLSVGYRVKSNSGIKFRKWANKVLKDYLLQGYSINEKRLKYLEKTLKVIDIATRIDESLRTDEANEILNILGSYTKALDLLDDYDYKRVKKVGSVKSKERITYDDCINIINKLKFNENSKLFALERDYGLKSIIEDIYQTFNGNDLYNTIEEKAANFLYLIVKNHVFIDGNKRIAATLFIYFLQFYNILIINGRQVIDNNTLTALTFLMAESNPIEKEIIIDLVMKFLQVSI